MFSKGKYSIVIGVLVVLAVGVGLHFFFSKYPLVDMSVLAVLGIIMFALKPKCDHEVDFSELKPQEQDTEYSSVGALTEKKEKRPPVFDFQGREEYFKVYLKSTKKPCAHGRVGGYQDKELISALGKLDARKLFNKEGKADVKTFLSGIFKEDPRNPNRLILGRKFSDQQIKKDKNGKYTFAPLGSTTGKQINIRELIVYTLLAMKDRYDMQNVIEDLPFSPENLKDFQEKFGEKYPDLSSFGKESFLDDICAFVNSKKFKTNGYYVTDAMIVMPEEAIETLNECLEKFDYSFTSLFEWISDHLQLVVNCKQQIDGDIRVKEYQLICGFDSEIGMIVGEVRM